MSKSGADFCRQCAMCGCNQRHPGPQAILSRRHYRTGSSNILCVADSARGGDIFFVEYSPFHRWLAICRASFFLIQYCQGGYFLRRHASTFPDHSNSGYDSCGLDCRDHHRCGIGSYFKVPGICRRPGYTFCDIVQEIFPAARHIYIGV